MLKPNPSTLLENSCSRDVEISQKTVLSQNQLMKVLHIISVSPLTLTLGFVSLHFDNVYHATFFFTLFVIFSLMFTRVLGKIVQLGQIENLIPDHITFVDKDPSRMLPMYVLPFVMFANVKTEDFALIIFVAGLLGYIMNGPLSLQTLPIFWIMKWRIYNVTTHEQNPGGLVTSQSVFVLTKKRIGEMSTPLDVVRLSPAFMVDITLFQNKSQTKNLSR